eukprot:1007738-Amphidinium_carterae.1
MNLGGNLGERHMERAATIDVESFQNFASLNTSKSFCSTIRSVPSCLRPSILLALPAKERSLGEPAEVFGPMWSTWLQSLVSCERFLHEAMG